MRLERHVGGLGRERQRNYLATRGWAQCASGWEHPNWPLEPYRQSRALHHQLTADLCAALARWRWRISGYSARGYAQLTDGVTGQPHTLPSALRVEARRQGQKVADFTYALFLGAVLGEGKVPGPPGSSPVRGEGPKT